MEGIRLLAQSAFEEEQLFDPRLEMERYYEAIELRASPDKANALKVVAERGDDEHATPDLQTLTPQELCSWLLSAPGHDENGAQCLPQALAALRIVRIRRQGPGLVISRSAFNRILDGMKADPAVKYMICRRYDGFHEYCGDGFRLTRFFGTVLFALVWTFDPASMTTTALFLERRTGRERGPTTSEFAQFVDVLWKYRSHIHTPSLLCFVSCYFLLQYFDHNTGGWELRTIHTIERETGFAPVSIPSVRDTVPRSHHIRHFDIDQLATWLRDVNEIVINVSNRVRHETNGRVLLEVIIKEHNDSEHHGISGEALRRCHSNLRTLAEAVPSIERHISTYTEYILYLKARAERLSTVLFALLTHEDASASIGLAAAAKHDSSSMKTIAVMTMAFLPATFFAALFAVPSLQWDHSKVVQENFWVYWAFTVPTTVLVFLVWLLSTKRAWIGGRAATLAARLLQIRRELHRSKPSVVAAV